MPIALSAGQHALELLERPAAARGRPVPATSWLSSRTACGGAEQPGSSRDSTLGRSARGPSRPGGATSSAGLDPPLLWGGWPPCAAPRRPPRRVRLRAVGKKGTATARAAERKRVGAALIIGVHPAQPGGGPPARAPGHLGGAAVLGDVKQSECPLAGAGMRCAQRQVTQVVRRLTPARILNTKHVPCSPPMKGDHMGTGPTNPSPPELP